MTDTGTGTSRLAEFEARARAFLEQNVPRRGTVGRAGEDLHSPEVFARERALQAKIFDAGFSLIGGLPVLTVFHTWTDKG